MTQYTFKMRGEYRTVKAEGYDEALKKAGIGKGESYEVMEIAHSRDYSLLASITDKILFGASGSQKIKSR